MGHFREIDLEGFLCPFGIAMDGIEEVGIVSGQAMLHELSLLA